jgi:hypothetical protein
MPANSDAFPWPSYYKHFNFFERRMRDHNRVRQLEPLDAGRYRLTRDNGALLEVFICECYSFGVAEYHEMTTNLGSMNAIIIDSVWCHYTDEIKLQCRSQQVGLFKIGDFMAALNRPDFWNYLNEFEEQRFKERGIL